MKGFARGLDWEDAAVRLNAFCTTNGANRSLDRIFDVPKISRHPGILDIPFIERASSIRNAAKIYSTPQISFVFEFVCIIVVVIAVRQLTASISKCHFDQKPKIQWLGGSRSELLRASQPHDSQL